MTLWGGVEDVFDRYLLRMVVSGVNLIFFFNDTATTEIYTYWHTLSLHDALPISASKRRWRQSCTFVRCSSGFSGGVPQAPRGLRSEEHTSELQSLMRISYAVFCLKKKKKSTKHN